MLIFDIFSFKALWSPYFLLVLIALTIGYFLLTVKYRTRFQNSEPLTKQQAGLFLTSMVLIYAIKGSPLDLMGHLMFYVHAITMVLLVFLVPPIFIMSVPPWLWRGFLSIKPVDACFKLFTKPVVAVVTFNGLFSFYHIPIIFDNVMQNRFYHGGYQILLFIAAIWLWWLLVPPLPRKHDLSGIKKVAYIFINGILITPSCALIIFADNPLYATYSDPTVWGKVMSLCVGTAAFANLNLSGPEMFSSMPLLYDQRLGGTVMKIIQEVIYSVILAKVFFEWYRKDQEESEHLLKQPVNPRPID
ncbi:cytochrome c oxidase assembly factor CtaG [Neobacillus dielmonensis]|uniref:cytochrome c oxidase assembly factor CtaG n=1 Tax=Neobacillus dielmonensis TaxID=1347369 RepID=UPI0005AB02ED|nr:cytochrome c oxidase assembly factor CtaG [Neobacillus dielmonensis]